LAMAIGVGGARAGTTDLPGGASSLNEVHGDWTVTCRLTPGKSKTPVKSCDMLQEQTNAKKQLALAVKLVPDGAKARGVMVLPFGVAVTREVTLAVDGTALGGKLSYSTCLRIGCLVPLAFDAKALTALEKGNKMTVSAFAVSRRKIALSVSLKGFSSALKRTRSLLQ